MAKTGTSRFDETLANLGNEKAAGYKLGKDTSEAIKKWMNSNPTKTKEALGSKLSLGGVRLIKNENETYLRHLRRGIILAFITVGDGHDSGISGLKTKIKNENKTALRSRLQKLLPTANAPVTNKVIKAEGGYGTFELSRGSWKFANSMAEQEAAASFTKASLLLNKAWSQGIMRLGQQEEKIRFERWFGNANNSNNVSTVKENLKKIHNTLCKKAVVLYYRGQGVENQPSDLPINEPWSNDGSMKKGDYFGAAWRHLHGSFDQTKSHMLLGDAFFTAVRKGTDSTAGVIVHELSHSECQTQDHKHPTQGVACYGHALCKDIAQNHTHLAIDNADNYEFYCEEFWQGVFDKQPNAVGSIPDDRKRKIAQVI